MSLEREFGPEPPPPDLRPRLRNVVSAFLRDKAPVFAQSTQGDRRRILLKMCRDLGDHLPADVQAADIRDWILKRKEWTTPETRAGVLRVLHSMFSYATSKGYLARNPVDGLKLPGADAGPPMSLWHYQLMLRSTVPAVRRVLAFIRWTGCLPEDARQLEWSWIDWERNVVAIPTEKHKFGHRTRLPKIVALDKPARALLAWLNRRRDRRGRHADTVFLNPRGRPWKKPALEYRLFLIRRATGLPFEATMHGIRRLFLQRAMTKKGGAS